MKFAAPGCGCIQEGGFFLFVFLKFCLIFYLESRSPTLNTLFIVNAMNVQYDAILAKNFPITCGVIVQMFRCVQIPSVGLV